MIEAFFGLDAYLVHLLYWLRFEPLVTFFFVVTLLGYFQVILSATVIFGIWLFWKNMQADALGLFVAVLGSGASALFLKYLVARPRPDVFFQVPPVLSDPSFPSAHAALAAAFLGYLVYLLLQVPPTRSRQFLIVILPALMVLIAFSRLYLGMHHLTDVLAGMTLGLFFVWFGVQYRLFALARYSLNAEKTA